MGIMFRPVLMGAKGGSGSLDPARAASREDSSLPFSSMSNSSRAMRASSTPRRCSSPALLAPVALSSAFCVERRRDVADSICRESSSPRRRNARTSRALSACVEMTFGTGVAGGAGGGKRRGRVPRRKAVIVARRKLLARRAESVGATSEPLHEVEVAGVRIGHDVGARTPKRTLEKARHAGREDHRLGTMPTQIGKILLVGELPDGVETAAYDERAGARDDLHSLCGMLEEAVRA